MLSYETQLSLKREVIVKAYQRFSGSSLLNHGMTVVHDDF